MGPGGGSPSPYTVHMDPDLARNLAQQGATVLMLGVPAGAIVGVDHQAFHVGPKFKGVKMLPPGPHFFSCRAAASSSSASGGPAGPGGVAPPTSCFLHLSPRQVVVRAWDAVTEQLLALRDDDEAERYAEGCRRFEFDSGLAPYDLASCRRWASLVSHVTAELISAVSPVGGSISVMAEAEDPDLLKPKTEAERELVRSLREGRERLGQRRQQAGQPGGAGEAEETEREEVEAEMQQPSTSSGPAVAREAAGSSGRCFYSHVPRLVKLGGLTAAELTSLNLDKSALVLRVAAERYRGSVEGLLGEMQFAFVAFVFGQSLDGFAQVRGGRGSAQETVGGRGERGEKLGWW
jgi:A1 cistron-splicing factor AAR2